MTHLNHPRCKWALYFRVVWAIMFFASVAFYVVERRTAKSDRESFNNALMAADAGRWYWDLKTNDLFWDDQMFILFGRVRGHWSPNYGGFESCIHPEDRDRVNRHVLEAIRLRTGYHDIFRIVTASGEIREIRASARVSPDGRSMSGICLPAILVTGPKQALADGEEATIRG